MSETPSRLAPEMRERPPLAPRVEMDTVAMSDQHPDYNEDAMLGDRARIEAELQELPEIDIDFDYKPMLSMLLKIEAKHADDLRERNVFAVLDGVGGGGEGRGLLASRIVSAEVSQSLAKLPLGANAQETVEALKAAIAGARDGLTAQVQINPELERASTTITAMRLIENADGTRQMAFAHLGDSRIYVFDKAKGQLRQITTDHGELNDALEKGQIDQATHDRIDQCEDPNLLSLEEYTLFDERNVVRKYVTADTSFEPQTGIVDLSGGDIVLMTSDGIHDNLTNAQIENILRNGGGMADLIREAASIAGQKLGRSKFDDLSGTLVEIPLRPDEKPKAPDSAERAQIENENYLRMEAVLAGAKPEISRLAKYVEFMDRGELGNLYGGTAAVAKLGGDAAVRRKLENLQMLASANEIGMARIALARAERLGHQGDAAKESALTSERARIETLQAELDARHEARKQAETAAAQKALFEAHRDAEATSGKNTVGPPPPQTGMRGKIGRALKKWLGL